MGSSAARRRLEDRLRDSDLLRRTVQRAERATANVVAAVVPRHVMRNKRLFDVWAKHDYYVLPAHFYEPVPDGEDLKRALERRSALIGIDLRPERQVELLHELRAWKPEYDALPATPDESDDGFFLSNTLFGSVDAEILYALIRKLKPKRVYEIGSGFSTLVASRAVRANVAEGAPAAELVAFEPYPSETLRRGVAGLTRLEARRLQDVPLEEFAALEAGDILFIDSSHVVTTGSDVTIELLEIVPRIASGVVVHVHDIFLPAEYPRRWLLEDRYFWTEQYLLHAFLAYNSDFEVLWSGQLMHLDHPDELRAAFASYAARPASPGSFWFRRVSA